MLNVKEYWNMAIGIGSNFAKIMNHMREIEISMNSLAQSIDEEKMSKSVGVIYNIKKAALKMQEYTNRFVEDLNRIISKTEEN